jgi:hypothetical protein
MSEEITKPTPDKASTYAIPIVVPSTYGIPHPVPIPNLAMTPVIPLPSPIPGFQKWLTDECALCGKYLNEDQMKILTKIYLDNKVDLMDAQLQLVNIFTKKQMDMLKRVSEMITPENG